MEKFKVNEIYVVRPMELVEVNRYAKLQFPYNILLHREVVTYNDYMKGIILLLKKYGLKKAEILDFLSQTYLSLASDITFAKDEGNFSNILGPGEFPKIEGMPEENYIETIVHTACTDKLSDILFAEEVKGCRRLSLRDLGAGIYASWVKELEELEEKIDTAELTVEELKAIKNRLVRKEKDKFITLKQGTPKLIQCLEGKSFVNDIARDEAANKLTVSEKTIMKKIQRQK